MINLVVLSGRICNEIELRYTNSNKAVCNLTLAVDKPFGNKETDFFQIVAWEKKAEFLNNYLGKGRKITITGRLENRKWEDKEGNKRTTTEVIANDIDFADSKNKSEQQETEAADDGFQTIGIEDDSLPF